ncbi:hypothetical protein BVRB_2g045470 [Beta vulgaris subsp. vulgaris]|uniref:Uncharacterized protein n=1 Tax=Beta vulgaris subsp. vulgaris TaxID=3555 RepID=A0A0J8BH93_BETVV|nr:hypothetical protein BVRB_2g045470 [Beta vulgaris subsp. vulgaris]
MPNKLLFPYSLKSKKFGCCSNIIVNGWFCPLCSLFLPQTKGNWFCPCFAFVFVPVAVASLSSACTFFLSLLSLCSPFS